MRDQDCVAFLQGHLPRLGLRWASFRKVRGTVCKRLRRRLRDLGLEDFEAYAAVLAERPEEWARLDAFCRIPISRFYRDREVFQSLETRVLPELARRVAEEGGREVRAWSAGCASGEEPYSLRIAWAETVQHDAPGVRLAVTATDADPTMLRRAEAACYGAGSLRDLRQDWRERAFTCRNETFCLRAAYKEGVSFLLQDIRTAMPEGPFHLVLCRNLVFTYFDVDRQRKLLPGLAGHMHPGAYLVLGSDEELPPGATGFRPAFANLPIFRKPHAANS
jgi:chemotaxis protein methyltransferase CheR